MVKDAVRFFNGTPVHALPPTAAFTGTGVYALYYTGNHPLYAPYANLNRLSCAHPIYVGKAVPRGWRQSRASDAGEGKQFKELHSRLRQHGRSVAVAAGLLLHEFSCRFVIFEHESSDMIGTIEAALIQLHRPLWNVSLDGFGNHDPGQGRYQQAKSDWDVIHPGRTWANKCLGQATNKQSIVQHIENHFKGLG